MSDITSAMPLNAWRGPLTMFANKFSTRPQVEWMACTWGDVVEKIAPAIGPLVVEEKDRSQFFLPCALSSAPLTGKTLQRALQAGEAAVGKQRSKSHVSGAKLLVVDLDGLSLEQLARVKAAIKCHRLAALFFTSHSHGRKDKPGVRMRCVVPLDRALDRASYETLHGSFRESVLGGLGDPTSAKLEQQQGVWSCSPSRQRLARRGVVAGQAIDVDRLLVERTPQPTRASKKSLPSIDVPKHVSGQLADALEVVGDITDAAAFASCDVPKTVLDGQGRELAVLQLAGQLRARGLSQQRIERLCLAYNLMSLIPPIDDDVVLDRAQRYQSTPCSGSAVVLAREWCAAEIRKAVTTGDWAHAKHWAFMARWYPFQFDLLRSGKVVL